MSKSESTSRQAQPVADVDPRLYMAAERTFLAWIRTGIALMAFGFVLARIEVAQSSISGFAGTDAGSLTFSLMLGISLVVTGIVVLLTSFWRHRVYVEAISSNRFGHAFGSGFALGLALLLGALGVLLALYLILH
ncbi:MAG: DUF202 domain-containing protein [Bryobacterales bacterium]|nr:DUF202 domain-containing protein [Bryobacterales bacterium]